VRRWWRVGSIRVFAHCNRCDGSRGGGGGGTKAWNGPAGEFLLRGLVSLTILGLIVIALLAAPWIAPFDPNAIGDPIGDRSIAPSWQHPMGTDPLGRDLLSRMLLGGRISLLVAAVSVCASTVVGVLVGSVSGVLGGIADRVLMRLVDVALGVPRILLLLAILVWFPTSGVPLLIVVLATTGWMAVARLVRGEVRRVLALDHVVAARAMGMARVSLWHRHVLPWVMPVIIVWATGAVAQLLLLEAGLSFLGVGVQPPTASWGTVLRDVSDVMSPARWLAIGPGVMIVVTVTAIQRVGDSLSDMIGGRGDAAVRSLPLTPEFMRAVS
jgi:peptide/nickel transport system permease protein